MLVFLGLGLALLCGCTTAVAGVPTAAGEPQRTTESQPSEPAETEESEPTETPEPAPSSAEGTACEFGAEAFPGVGLLIGVVVFEETSGLFPVPSEGREDVAQVLDAVLIDTQPMLDALPPGAVREAFAVSRNESALLRDAMRAPATGPLVESVDDGFVAAFQALKSACEGG